IGNSNHSKHKTGCHAKAKKPHTALRALLLVVVIVGAIALGGYAWLKFGLSAPDVSDRQRGTSATEGTTPEPVEEHTAPPEDLPSQPAVPVNPDKEQPDPVEEEPAPTTASSGKKYTFAILGMDDGNGNSDTIMTATFDADNYTLNVVSIPRDTLVNVSWYTKKANTWYAMGGKEKGVLNGMRDLLGYQPDYYVIVDLDAFIKLIDGIGGVYYDVPQNMKYSDPYQDLYIDIKAGPQLLSGEDSMKVVRFRRYLEGDIKRISVQQDFLKTMMREVL
ncbi:MAG: LCP family glycopolymer transferase, partial [bacterium]